MVGPDKGVGDRKEETKKKHKERAREKKGEKTIEEAKSARLLIDVLEDATTWRDRQRPKHPKEMHILSCRWEMQDACRYDETTDLVASSARPRDVHLHSGLYWPARRADQPVRSGNALVSNSTRAVLELLDLGKLAARTAYRRRDAFQFFLVDIINKCIIIIKINHQRRTRSFSHFSSLFSLKSPNEFLFLAFSLID